MHMLVAEHNDTIRLGIRSVLDRHGKLMTVDEVSSKEELMVRLDARGYELILIEPTLCGGTPDNLIKQVCQTSPQANVLVFTGLDEMTFGTRAIRSGAKGYLMKTCSTAEFLTAVERVRQGKTHISTALAEECAINLYKGEGNKAHEFLSDRELETFAMLVCGNSISQIAAVLERSVKTISTHKARAMSKLQVTSLSELIHYAISQGLMDKCQAQYAQLMSRPRE